MGPFNGFDGALDMGRQDPISSGARLSKNLESLEQPWKFSPPTH